MKRYRVQVYWISPKGIKNHMGTWEGFAVCLHAAEMEARKEYWDNRLYSADCTDHYETAVIREPELEEDLEPEGHEDEDEEEVICDTCNGSGEGMADGTICSRCHGQGALFPLEEERRRAEYDDEMDRKVHELMERKHREKQEKEQR